MPRAISTHVVTSAIRPGKRMTKRESRYQKPSVMTADSRSRRRCRRAGASAFTRRPSSTSTAGSTVSEIRPESSATNAPPTPIEFRKFCGKSISEPVAPATVTEENSTVRPAVARVRRMASTPGPVRAISSR